MYYICQPNFSKTQYILIIPILFDIIPSSNLPLSTPRNGGQRTDYSKSILFYIVYYILHIRMCIYRYSKFSIKYHDSQIKRTRRKKTMYDILAYFLQTRF